MKTTIFTAVLALLVTLPINAFTTFSTMEVEDKKDLKLEGETEDDNPKSLLFPFGAYQIDNLTVNVVSYNDCPSFTIHILDACGNTIDTWSAPLSALQTVTFSINGYAPGIYTLVITTPTGTYLTGTFEVE